MIYGIVSNMPWWGYIVTTFIFCHITNLAITLYLHREQSHLGLKLHPIISHFFRFWLWLTTGMKTKDWVSIHRKHHARCEKEDDPHSPQVVGLKTVVLYGSELYRREALNQETLEKYGRGTPDDWLERNVYHYNVAGVTSMLFIDLLLFGIPGVMMWSVQMMWSPFWAAGIINGVGHYLGYRNFETKDASRNIVPWGILLCGEELHNNHHAFGTSAKFSVRWWEFDLGWLYIKLFSLFKLVKVKRVIPKVLYSENEKIDLSTVKALFKNRMHILADYTQHVVWEVYKKESPKLAGRGHQLKQLLAKERTLISEQEQEIISNCLEQAGELREVYDYRQKLQSIWESTRATHNELCDKLRNWCAAAESSGIDALSNFSHKIKHLTVSQEA